MTFFRSAILPIAAALVVLSVGCRRNNNEGEPFDVFILKEGKFFVPEASPLRNALQIQAVEELLIEAGFSAPASVEADPADVVKFHVPMPGRIEKIHVRLGDSVTKGQALVTIDSSELAQLNAEYQKAKSAERKAKRDFDRVTELYQHDIASKKELEESETEYSFQQSELKQAEIRFIQLGVQPGDITGGILVLRSPIDGKVSEMEASGGSYWNDSSAPLMVIANLSNVYFTASVQEKDIPRLYPGQAVSVAVTSFSDEVFKTKVMTTGELLDPETRTVKVRLPIENSGHRLLPSMYATANFMIKPHAGIMVPVSAVIQDAKGSKVFVESSDWVFEDRAVQTGIESGNQIEIIKGLSAGERIVAREGVLLHVH
ncbi:MAG: efflux RND transporter periplasmic adaptor subunit [Holophagales bacterium]|jgi:cobalt-zinc-cadmium efflux system membrane fusion protein|nr:efflux RND transporter periplasmic adaptor subunit [Holophagales bacterium]